MDALKESFEDMASVDGRFQQRLSSDTGDVREPVWSPFAPAQR
jgi:hypothetical protein